MTESTLLPISKIASFFHGFGYAKEGEMVSSFLRQTSVQKYDMFTIKDLHHFLAQTDQDPLSTEALSQFYAAHGGSQGLKPSDLKRLFAEFKIDISEQEVAQLFD